MARTKDVRRARWWLLACVTLVMGLRLGVARADAPLGYKCGDGKPVMGKGCACPAGKVDARDKENNAICVAAPVAPIGPSGPAPIKCDAGEKKCDGVCVDPKSSSDHCGKCGNACAGFESCDGGKCGCLAPYAKCGGACTDVKTNALHCGKCGNACPSGATCAGGVCRCGASAIPLDSDPKNCGKCGNVCPVGMACTNGACKCNGTICSGSCKSTGTDPKNCGSCENVCDIGATCSGGTCACGSELCGCGNADPKKCAEARVLYQEAMLHMEQNEADTACDKLRRSLALRDNGAVQHLVGDCFASQGDPVLAWQSYVAAAAKLTDAKEPGRAASATTAANHARSKIAMLKISLLGDQKGVEITVAGKALSPDKLGIEIPFKPGEVEIAATAPDKARWSEKITLTGGGTADVEVPVLASAFGGAFVRLKVRCVGTEGLLALSDGLQATLDDKPVPKARDVLVWDNAKSAKVVDYVELETSPGQHALHLEAAGCAAQEIHVDAQQTAPVVEGSLEANMSRRITRFVGTASFSSVYVMPSFAILGHIPDQVVQDAGDRGSTNKIRYQMSGGLLGLEALFGANSKHVDWSLMAAFFPKAAVKIVSQTSDRSPEPRPVSTDDTLVTREVWGLSFTTLLGPRIPIGWASLSGGPGLRLGVISSDNSAINGTPSRNSDDLKAYYSLWWGIPLWAKLEMHLSCSWLAAFRASVDVVGGGTTQFTLGLGYRSASDACGTEKATGLRIAGKE